ncbi:response regulator [Candidatus Sulfurimonas marisnigri]|uniref:Response regulator n=1 Tax=Candidatus Sulfurimonas marisnigri TaxID=2740405 RepID=A0A7S7RR30_9BACT|nr:response regulator [Candidatus Sulfurimonas marisnigri]QOY55301.1 response regulator [Candidatus Sulfurimonas marisnigri]
MDKKIVHEIGNYLHQIISSADSIIKSDEFCDIGERIKKSAYNIDALLTDSSAKKTKVDISKNSTYTLDMNQFCGLNIMIVDDVIENINIMSDIFQTLSCNIKSATSGEDALDIFNNGFKPDIVCMDIVMPGMDGTSTTKELRLLGCSAYFIAVSALKNQPNTITSTFDCWLPKPFTSEHIMGALLGYNTRDIKDTKEDNYKLEADISSEVKNELLRLAKVGAYSELDRLISTLENSRTKTFLSSSLRRVDFTSIIKSIVSP